MTGLRAASSECLPEHQAHSVLIPTHHIGLWHYLAFSEIVYVIYMKCICNKKCENKTNFYGSIEGGNGMTQVFIPCGSVSVIVTAFMY